MLNFRFLVCCIPCIFCQCSQEVVPPPYVPKTDYEAYFLKLQSAELLETALGQAWVKAADEAMSQAVAASIPFEESFYFSDKNPTAYTYRLVAKRGEKIKITVKQIASDEKSTALLFVDLFRIDEEADGGLVHVASSDRDQNRMAFEPNHDAQYLLRLQPELLRGGRYTLHITTGPALDFPVAEGENRDIGSFFGDPRDGGRRKHHGIDIFAKRHTPIIAPCAGYIRFVGERGLGGRVVWMRDTLRNMTLYFAHLQEIIAQKDTWVSAGDTLGTVGNTGNARTTPPHLHFGIYKDGPIDPFHFVARNRKRPKTIQGDSKLLGTIVRTDRNNTALKGNENMILEVLPKNQWLQIEALRDNLVRTRLPNGIRGYLNLNHIEPAQGFLSAKLPETAQIKDGVLPSAQIVEEYTQTQDLKALARHEQQWYVETDSGLSGWVEGSQ